MPVIESDASIDTAELRDALDHIARVARASRTQSRRDRWIAARAESALQGNSDWKDLDIPKNIDTDVKRLRRKLAAVQNGTSHE